MKQSHIQLSTAIFVHNLGLYLLLPSDSLMYYFYYKKG